MLALLRRNPGLTTGEIAAYMSGMTKLDARRAVNGLRDCGHVTRSKNTPVQWFPVEKEKPEPAPSDSKYVSYSPPSMAPARNDACQHELIGSRRGDEIVPHAPPLGMMNGFLGDKGNHSHTLLVKKPVSPLYSNTFCKLAPDAKPGRKKVAA
ncbi:MAG: MarR family transcriptional regulator [Burkholderiales bacterium]|nr:MarR family transcriptional regulator [Burkholderiales bacterium]